jgi:hypothetical protein
MFSFLRSTFGFQNGGTNVPSVQQAAPWQDYPFNPLKRALETSPGGKELVALFESSHKRFRELLDLVVVNDQLLRAIPFHTDEARSPRWVNEMFPCVDGAILYSLLKRENPKLYVEIGSGNSTKFARRAIEDNRLRTKIVSIDPKPRAEIDELCDQIIRVPLEEVSDFSIFANADCVFFDGSHRAFQNTDVTVFFTEIIPTLARGCFYGIHDIALPYDYPDEWRDRLYNEQYILAAYLLGGASGDEVVFPTAYVCQSEEFWTFVQNLFLDWDHKRSLNRTGGAFWLRKGEFAGQKSEV